MLLQVQEEESEEFSDEEQEEMAALSKRSLRQLKEKANERGVRTIAFPTIHSVVENCAQVTPRDCL